MCCVYVICTFTNKLGEQFKELIMYATILYNDGHVTKVKKCHVISYKNKVVPNLFKQEPFQTISLGTAGLIGKEKENSQQTVQ